MSGTDGLGDFSLLDLFRQEAESQTAILNDGLLAIEREPASAESLEALMRAAHSLKGAARIVQLDPIVHLAHAMEDVFVAAQEGKLTLASEHVDVLLRATDLLTGIAAVGEAEAPAWLAENAGPMAELSAACRALLTQPPASPASPTPPPEPGPAQGAPAPSIGDLSMLELFRQEAEGQTAILNDGLLAIEREPASAESLEALMRAAHSLKGAARIVQIDPIVHLAHAMEDVFVAAQEGKLTLASEHVDVLLRATDLLTGIATVEEAEAPNWLAEKAEGMAGLARDCTALLTRPAGPPRPPETKPGPSPEPPPAKAEEPQPEPTAHDSKPASAESQDRVVRVTAEHLNRLMGLAGECLVEAGLLEPMAGNLLSLKAAQRRLGQLLERLQETIEERGETVANYPSLFEARQRLGACRDMLGDSIGDFEMFSRRLQNLTERLYREVIGSRMRPFADGARGFPRMIRDLARNLGKKVRLDIIGLATEVDRDILEKLEAPLNHILRNAVDHGVDPPEERKAAGKPAEGLVRIEARHQAGMLSVTVSDDGQGIDLDKLRARVVERELSTAEMAAGMSEAELLEFLFLPGFSTAGAVTETSGRGVGLDVVQSMVQEVGGLVRVTTSAGRGTAFHLQLPITLSVLRTLLVEISGEPYAFPLARIDRIIMLPRDQLLQLEDRQYCQVDGDNVGLISAHQVLEREETASHADSVPVLVISDRLDRYGIVVDRFLGERDLVVRPLDPRLGKVRDLNAAALMEDGTPALIVDVDDMVRSIDTLLSGGRLRRLGGRVEQAEEAGRKRVLVVDDSLTVREVERKLLENNGYEVDVAVDGMDGWNALRTGHYDLVITDVDMPRMNGIELVTQIKQDARLRYLPVMIVSYKDREEDRQRGLDAGANYYLTKSSFHDETLLTAVVDMIGEATP